jgi:hypothetical protein
MRWISFLAAFVVSQPVYGQATPEPVSVAAPRALSTELPSYELSGTPEEGLFFVVENFPLEQDADVEAMIGAEAQRRCAPKIAFPGNYRRMPGTITVKGENVVGIARYERLALCVDPMKPIAPASSVFHPTPDDESDLISTFNTYFSAFDANDVDTLLPLRDYPPFPRKVLLQEIGDYKLQHGEKRRNILKTSWYPNPPELHNGIFGEVLFSQPISDTNMLCGAAMFYRRAEHDFVLSRVLTGPIEGPSKGTEDLQSCSR